jgi:formate-dependent nitrite reductase cytochrome c552 subunit
MATKTKAVELGMNIAVGLTYAEIVLLISGLAQAVKAQQQRGHKFAHTVTSTTARRYPNTTD